MVYIRKIEENRWRNPHFYDSDVISDLVTSEHDLSVWCYKEGDEDEKRKALLALVMSRSDFKDFFYIEISDKELKRFHYSMNDKEGNTFFGKYRYLHRNIEVRTVMGLTTLAWIMKRKIYNGKLLHIEVDEEIDLFKMYAIPSEMIEDELSKKYHRLYLELNQK